MRRTIRAILVVSLGTVIAGCQQKSDAGQTATPEASNAQPVGKVEKAVANAVGAAPASASSSGPPADGILEPARAEAEAPSGRAPKLTIGSSGSAPRVALRSSKATLPRNVKVEVSLQAGLDQAPPIELTLGLETKPLPTTKASGASEPSAADANATEKAHAGAQNESKGLLVTAKIRDAKVAMPNVPAELTQQIAQLKGGKVTFTLGSDGAGYGFTSELAPGAKPELKDLLETASEALLILTLPVPSEPVGSGAFWMVASREKSAGFGIVGYHMVKLTRADEKSSEFELDSRRYAIGHIVDPAMLPPGSENVTLKEFSGGIKARVQLTVDSRLPTSVEANASLRGTLDSGDGAQKRAVQSSTGYRITSTR